MKKIILFLIFFTSVLMLFGCDQAKENQISKNDVTEGTLAVKNYFAALKVNDIDGVNKTLGRYKSGMYNENNIKGWQPQLISVESPGKYHNDNTPPSSYKSNYGKDPYKFMNLYVEFKEGTQKQGWDYLLIKETEDSPWLIHDWGY